MSTSAMGPGRCVARGSTCKVARWGQTSTYRFAAVKLNAGVKVDVIVDVERHGNGHERATCCDESSAVDVKVLVKVIVEDKVEDVRNRVPSVGAGRMRPGARPVRLCRRRNHGPVIDRGNECTWQRVHRARAHRLGPLALLNAFCTSRAPPGRRGPLRRRRTRQDPPGPARTRKRKGAAVIHRCAQNEHDRSTVGVSIPYACA